MSTTTHKEAQISVASNSQTDSILNINGRKAVATKNLIAGFEINKNNFNTMWARNQNEFLENEDWNWFDSFGLQIVTHQNSPKVSRIFYSKGVSKASTKFNSPKAKEFAQKMFDNYGSQLDGETKLVKVEDKSAFTLPTNYEEALEALLLRVKTEKQLTLENEELKPKAQFVDEVLVKGNTGLSAMSIVAKEIGLGPVKLYKLLRDRSIWFYALNEHGVNENTVNQKYIDNDYFVLKTFFSERDKRTYDKIFATNKGKLLCHKLVKQENEPKFEITVS